MSTEFHEVVISDDRSAAIQRACSDIVQRFAHHIDNHDFADAEALFCEDAVFVRPNIRAEGRLEIGQMWAGRPRHELTRHLCFPSLFTTVNEHWAEAITPFLLFRATGQAADRAPSAEVSRAESPAIIAEYRDHFRLTPEGWRIARRQGLPRMSSYVGG